jgi:hypothetical protein
MKFWLIAFLFGPDGEYVGKMESQYQSYGSCVVAAGAVTAELVNSSIKIQSWCVSDNHYKGVEQDEGIPYDMHGVDGE